jgi:hypothetical protein
VPFTLLYELEIPNAFELLVGRGAISREECRAIHAQLQEDLDSQRLAWVPLEGNRDRIVALPCQFGPTGTNR